jgi:hypothetical protein
MKLLFNGFSHKFMYVAYRIQQVTDSFLVAYNTSIDKYKIVIIDLGSHPVAYVGIPPTHKYSGVDYENWPDDLQVCVNGGFTYASHGGTFALNDPLDKDHYWIGWDYAHYGDHLGYDKVTSGRKWKFIEVLSESCAVIEGLINEDNST